MQDLLDFFDSNGDGSIDTAEFIHKHKELNLPGDPKDIIQYVDVDHDGSLTIEELQRWFDSIWSEFKRWIVRTCTSEEDFLKKVRKKSAPMLRHTAIVKPGDADRLTPAGQATRADFVDHLSSLGWYLQFESVLYDHLDQNGDGVITASDLSFFQEEMRAYRSQMNLKSVAENAVRGDQVLLSLRAFLRKHYGSMFTAWRLALHKDGDGRLPRIHFEKAVHLLGWQGDVEAVCQALDPMDPKFVCFEDLCFLEAQLMARFRQWLERTLRPPRRREDEGLDVHRILDLLSKAGKVKRRADGGLRKKGFHLALTNLSCPLEGEAVYSLLDSDQSGSVGAADFTFLYKVHFSLGFAAEPNPEAAQEFCELLLKTYGTMLPAWRHGIDRDGSGKAKWREITAAATAMGFLGDMNGALCALDQNGQGYLTLNNLDPALFDTLSRFRSWAWAKFGGVMVAFKALDTDGQGSLSKVEFGKAAYAHGFKFNLERTWSALNCTGGCTLDPADVAWLDRWQVEMLNCRLIEDSVQHQQRDLSDDNESNEEFMREAEDVQTFVIDDVLRSVGWQFAAETARLGDAYYATRGPCVGADLSCAAPTRRRQALRPIDVHPAAGQNGRLACGQVEVSRDVDGAHLARGSRPAPTIDPTVGLPLVQASPRRFPVTPPRSAWPVGGAYLADSGKLNDATTLSPSWLRKALTLEEEPRIYWSTCSSRGRYSRAPPDGN